MRHAALHGPAHHHTLHDMAAGAKKVIHLPGFWITAGFVMVIAVILALTLIYGTPSHPSGWDTYMWMPY